MKDPVPLAVYSVVDNGDGTFSGHMVRGELCLTNRRFWTREDAEAWADKMNRRPPRD